jgi:hypothetical protein
MTFVAGASIDDASAVVILEPKKKWRGEKLPIVSEVDINDQLAAGEWTLLLYHHDCPQCQGAVPRYVKLAEQLAQAGSESRVALVETPPYVPGERGVELPATCVAGKLSDSREWFAPVKISVKDGRVINIR